MDDGCMQAWMMEGGMDRWVAEEWMEGREGGRAWGGKGGRADRQAGNWVGRMSTAHVTYSFMGPPRPRFLTR